MRPRRTKRCGCGKGIYGTETRCSECRNYVKIKHRVARGTLFSNEVPGHEERMALYTRLASEEKPLFPLRGH